LQSRPTASRKEKADVDTLVISVDNMEESFVLDGGMKRSDASLDGDDGRVESVKDPRSLDVKEA